MQGMEHVLVVLALGAGLLWLSIRMFRSPEETLRDVTRVLSRGRHEQAGRPDQTRLIAVPVALMGAGLALLSLWQLLAAYIPWLRLGE